MLLHATCVAFPEDGADSTHFHGILLAGPSGIGKSEVALALIESGAQLVADDQVVLSVIGGLLYAAPPPSLAGFMEVRHVGLLKCPYQPQVPVSLYVELVALNVTVDRLPNAPVHSLLDCPVRSLKLPAYAASTPLKIRTALFGNFIDA